MAREMKCPRCGRGTLIIEGQSQRDKEMVAVCRFVAKCGLRVVIPNGRQLSEIQRHAHIRRMWRTDGHPH